MMTAKKSSDGQCKRLECGDGGELKVILYGTTISGELLPILVDADGCILTTPSA
jgi:hypothetical protein